MTADSLADQNDELKQLMFLGPSMLETGWKMSDEQMMGTKDSHFHNFPIKKQTNEQLVKG